LAPAAMSEPAKLPLVPLARRLFDRIPAPVLAIPLWTLLVGMAYFFLNLRPRSVLGWVALLVLGPPLWLGLEWLGEVGVAKLSQLSPLRQITTHLDAQMHDKAFSWLRITYGVVVALIAFGVLWGAVLLLGLG